ncbi:MULTISPECIES: hypothetical protein [unclassified Luteococcus]|uniref:hypothetical protein n=1 Tax=unclassified Luteococcus TaxID=2639923 RepID=UPI00313D35CE
MSDNNSFAPDADQDPTPETAPNLDAQPTGDDIAPDPIESVGEPRQDDSQADRVRDAAVTVEARESASDFGRDEPGQSEPVTDTAQIPINPYQQREGGEVELGEGEFEVRGDHGRDSDGNHLGTEDGAVQTGLDRQQY